MKLDEFKQLPIMGILRGIEISSVRPLCETVLEAGMQTVEITMNTPQAGKLIQKMIKSAKSRLTVGAGTVLNKEELKIALDNGASFIVMPVCVPEVMQHCLKKNIPVFPGALTPQEVYNAWEQGASMVKVFPASVFGPKYFKDLKGPFVDLCLMAVGGVRGENVAEYFARGAQAVAVGASIFNLEKIKQGKFSAIKQALSKLIKQVRKSL